MPGKKTTSKLFMPKAPLAKMQEQEKNQNNMLSIFEDFYLVKVYDKYILQIGLKKSFVPADNFAEDLSDYCNAILPIKLILEELRLIPANSDYIIVGHSAGHEVIKNEGSPGFLLECNMKAGNYLAIKLPKTPTIELANRLKEIGLPQRDSQYTHFVEGKHSNAPTAALAPNPAPTPSFRGR